MTFDPNPADPRDTRDQGERWAGIVEAPNTPAEHLPDAEAWETVSSPPDFYRRAAEPPLAYPGRQEQHRDELEVGEPLHVRVVHPLDVHDRVPDRLATMTIQVSTTQAVRLAPVNRRRAGILIAPAVTIRVGDANTTPTNGLTVTAGAPLTIATTDEVWGVALTTAGLVDVMQTWHDAL